MSRRARRAGTSATVLLLAAVVACTSPTGRVASDPRTTAAPSPNPTTAPVTLVVESWRPEDRATWESDILPVFEAQHPNIDVVFAPTSPDDYDREVSERLEANAAGDVIMCRPSDLGLTLFESGQLKALDGDRLRSTFGTKAVGAWTNPATDEAYCSPIASVMHGFLYNETIFDELQVEPPTTTGEFDALLDTITDDGRYHALSIGLHHDRMIGIIGLHTIGPTYWKGEQGHAALLEGTAASSAASTYTSAFAALQTWAPHLPDGAEAIDHAQAQRLFTNGEAAILPAGSWSLSTIDEAKGLKYSAFPPPRLDGVDDCYVTDHIEMAVGINQATPHPDAAAKFVEWTASSEFARLYSEALPGFYPLHRTQLDYTHDVARTIESWRGECETSVRFTSQHNALDSIAMEADLWAASAGVVLGSLKPSEAAELLATHVQRRVD